MACVCSLRKYDALDSFGWRGEHPASSPRDHLLSYEARHITWECVDAQVVLDQFGQVRPRLDQEDLDVRRGRQTTVRVGLRANPNRVAVVVDDRADLRDGRERRVVDRE